MPTTQIIVSLFIILHSRPDISCFIFVGTVCCSFCSNVYRHFVLRSVFLTAETQPFPYSTLLSSPLPSLGFFGEGGFNRLDYFLGGLITSCVLCIAPPAPPPSGPPSTLTTGGSSTLSKKRPPPPPPGHKRTLSDPPSPLSHSPHSKGGLTGGEKQAHVTIGLQPEA